MEWSISGSFGKRHGIKNCPLLLIRTWP